MLKHSQLTLIKMPPRGCSQKGIMSSQADCMDINELSLRRWAETHQGRDLLTGRGVIAARAGLVDLPLKDGSDRIEQPPNQVSDAHWKKGKLRPSEMLHKFTPLDQPKVHTHLSECGIQEVVVDRNGNDGRQWVEVRQQVV